MQCVKHINRGFFFFNSRKTLDKKKRHKTRSAKNFIIFLDLFFLKFLFDEKFQETPISVSNWHSNNTNEAVKKPTFFLADELKNIASERKRIEFY